MACASHWNGNDYNGHKVLCLGVVPSTCCQNGIGYPAYGEDIGEPFKFSGTLNDRSMVRSMIEEWCSYIVHFHLNSVIIVLLQFVLSLILANPLVEIRHL